MEIIQERKRVTEYHYEREFTDKPHCGFCFDCDEKGNLLGECSEAAKKHYQDCIDGKYPNLKDRGVAKIEYSYMQPAIGICEQCGTEVILHDEYYGTCQCEECGAWYNLFGQPVLAPSEYDIESSY